MMCHQEAFQLVCALARLYGCSQAWRCIASVMYEERVALRCILEGRLLQVDTFTAKRYSLYSTCLHGSVRAGGLAFAEMSLIGGIPCVMTCCF
jgi:hypothetical protein